METSSIHKVSEHLRDRLPYQDPPFPKEVNPDVVTLPLLDRGIIKQKELLEREGLDDTMRLEVIQNLLGLASDSENKIKFLSESAILDSVMNFIDPSGACSTAVCVASTKLVTKICTLPHSITTIHTQHPQFFTMLGKLLAFENGEEEEKADLRLAASECFSVLSSSRDGWTAIAHCQDEGKHLLSVLVSDGLRQENSSPDKTRESIGLILDSITRLCRFSPDTIDELLKYGVVPAALEFLPRANTAPATDPGANLINWLREHIDTETTLLGALSLLHSLSANPSAQMDISDHKVVHSLSPLLTMCLEVMPDIEKMDGEYVEVVFKVFVECTGIICLNSTKLEGKQLLFIEEEGEYKISDALSIVFNAWKMVRKDGAIEKMIRAKVASDYQFSEYYHSLLLVAQNIRTILNSVSEWPPIRHLIEPNIL